MHLTEAIEILRHRAYRANNLERLRVLERNRSRQNYRLGKINKIADLNYKVRAKVRSAVFEGKIIKPTHCQECNKPKEKHLLQGHHKDYSKPFKVIWVCSACHGLYHRKHISKQQMKLVLAYKNKTSTSDKGDTNG